MERNEGIKFLKIVLFKVYPLIDIRNDYWLKIMFENLFLRLLI